MTFVSGYWMIFNLFKIEQIYNSLVSCLEFPDKALHSMVLLLEPHHEKTCFM